MQNTIRGVWVCLFALALGGCAKRTAGPERIAVLRFENLSSDASISWMGRAFSEVIAGELTGAPGLQVIAAGRLHGFDAALGARPISAPGISTERTQALLAGATRIVYGDYTVRDGKLEAEITIEDPRELKATQWFAVSAGPADVLGAATAAARRISPRASAYATQNPVALAAYAQSLESGEALRLEQGLNAAIQADRDFAPPYGLLAQGRAQRGDRAGALSVLDQALARGDRIGGLARARLELQAAQLRANPAEIETALANLVKLDAADVASWRGLAEVAVARHDYRRALDAFRKAAEIEPADAGIWNSLGYAATYAGDPQAGMAALRRYETLRPNEANPLDSMGDVQFVTGRFGEAEKFYLDAHKKDANFINGGELLKAAMAHLFTLDVAGADRIAAQYFDARREAKDPSVDYRHAQWQWLTGRRREGLQQMLAFAQAAENGHAPDAASRALAEASLWKLMLGDREAASQLAAKAVGIASPAARGSAIVAAFLSLPPAPASEWTVRAERQFGPQTQIKNFALAYALAVNRQFAPAQLRFKEMWDSGGSAGDEGLPVMLAWCDLETGKTQEAAPLLKFNPMPGANGFTPYVSFYLPRLFSLRAALAEKEGRAEEARAEMKKFEALSGAK